MGIRIATGAVRIDIDLGNWNDRRRWVGYYRGGRGGRPEPATMALLGSVSSDSSIASAQFKLMVPCFRGWGSACGGHGTSATRDSRSVDR